ncbi:hypothetical protein SCHPADRAFT_885280 [Schizopora paradoxa]|uniref:RNI-like protein n=1 Tax=Schizopora paradoxa TaxID=27342 RepID=A0A0H2S639_9AGAM|nr:hypothetical protein SCHPADRAFT_885280 [Schizopora paradoxa]
MSPGDIIMNPTKQGKITWEECALPSKIKFLSNVRYLNLNQTNISKEQALLILKSLPQLTVVDFHIKLEPTPTPVIGGNLNQPEDKPELFALVNLKALRLAWHLSSGAADDLSEMLESFYAPNLNELVIQGMSTVGLEEPWFSLLNFLKNSGSQLQALSVGDFGIKDCLLSSCLRVTPNIQYLTLHQGKLQGHDLQAMMYNERDPSQTIAPNLQAIKLGSLFHTPREDLVNFIENRSKLPKGKDGIPILRNIDVTYVIGLTEEDIQRINDCGTNFLKVSFKDTKAQLSPLLRMDTQFVITNPTLDI